MPSGLWNGIAVVQALQILHEASATSSALKGADSSDGSRVTPCSHTPYHDDFTYTYPTQQIPIVL